MFVGRKKEIKKLEQAYESNNSQLAVIYGRRRIGKSRLIKHFVKNKKESFLFEGIENLNTADQIKHFANEISKSINDNLVNKVNFSSWEDIFNYFTEKVVKQKNRKKKLIISFDEIQWMAANRSKLISILKYFYDNHWKEHNVMIILCGSIASFMLRKVVNSKALYGRITVEIALKGLKPDEAMQFFNERKSIEEIMKYLLIFGTVPKYLEQIRQDRSFSWNINDLCFSNQSVMFNEVEKIFYNHFKETQTYLSLVNHLKNKILGHKEISKLIKMPSGGGLSRYLKTLEQAEIIRSFVPFGRKPSSTTKKYALSDEFLTFFNKYMKDNLNIIENSNVDDVFEVISKDSFEIWLGFAFERFCLKHALFFAEQMDFGHRVINYGPYFEKSDNSFQIDLLYQTADKVIVVCEIKYHNREISRKVINEMKRKLSLLRIPRGFSTQTALISLYGPDEGLRDANFFDHYFTLKNSSFTNWRKQ